MPRGIKDSGILPYTAILDRLSELDYEELLYVRIPQGCAAWDEHKVYENMMATARKKKVIITMVFTETRLFLTHEKIRVNFELKALTNTRYRPAA